MEQALVYIAYLVAALGSAALYAALPKEEGATRRAFLVPVLALAIGALVILLGALTGEAGRQVYFYILSILTLGGALRVVTHPKPVYSALFFVMVVLSTAAMIVLAGAEFLAAALVIVYAGAILVTYVFVIMLAQQSAAASGGGGRAMDYDRTAREPLAAVIAGFVLMATIAGVIVGRDWSRSPLLAPVESEGNTLSIGKLLLTEFAVSVELAGVLLMVAMIGAIAIARRRVPGGGADRGYVPGEAGKYVRPF
jgi:NADH-quinone oxidoreductase subunit J